MRRVGTRRVTVLYRWQIKVCLAAMSLQRWRGLTVLWLRSRRLHVCVWAISAWWQLQQQFQLIVEPVKSNSWSSLRKFTSWRKYIGVDSQKGQCTEPKKGERCMTRGRASVNDLNCVLVCLRQNNSGVAEAKIGILCR